MVMVALAGCDEPCSFSGCPTPPPPPPPPPPPIEQSVSGVWNGQTDGFISTTDDIRCVVSETLEVACRLTDPVTDEVIGAAQATIQVTNIDQVSGTGTLYAAPGFLLNDGSVVAALTIAAGTVSQRNSLVLDIDAAGAVTRVSTTYDVIYERASDLAIIEAVYTTFDILGDPSSFAIDAAGVISGQSNAGCMLAGQVTIIDAAFNAYDVSVDVTNIAACAVGDGTYDGLGLTQDMNATDDVFLFGVFTNQTAIIGAPVK